MRRLGRARALICPSRATADDVRRLCPRQPLHVVPHGVDEVFFAQPETGALAELDRLLPIGDRRLVLHVSSGFFYKNDAAVATIFAQLAAQRPDVCTVRIGRPGPVAMPRQTRRLAYVSATTLAAMFRRAAVLVFPSWDEGFGWPPLEAMAAGLPVVASACGALAETAAPAAITVPPDAPQAIFDAVCSVLDEPGRAAELAERGRHHASTYRWSVAANDMASIYRTVLDECA